MFKKILVPLDGSDLAAKILPKVEELAKLCDAEVTLIMVGASATNLAGIASPEIFEKAAEHDSRFAKRYLEGAANELQGKGVKVNWFYEAGMPAQTIIKHASDNNFDLIALATHGKGEVAWVMGSTAEKILSHATVPVFLLRVMEYKPPLLKEQFFM
ncbi:MAG: universal stress protein [Deltaproteobacteria bacterium]|nr:universal stress protein [Deltaproteobacteria bacterium]